MGTVRSHSLRTREYSMPAVMATWPSRLNQPVTQLASGLCTPAKRLLQKYRPPDVGYAARRHRWVSRGRSVHHQNGISCLQLPSHCSLPASAKLAGTSEVRFNLIGKRSAR